MSRYKAYPEYKESGVESIGAIPSEWQVWKWKHLLLSPMTYGANEAALDDNRNHPRYIRITDMNADGTLRDDSFKSLTPIVARDYLLQDGDILVARTGATVGKSFLYKREFGTSCFAGYLIRARVNQKIVSSKFVYWYMQSDQYWKFISGSQIQATIQNVSAEKYGDMEFAVPDLTAFCEQIANFLDHETAKIDTLIAKQQELIKLLKEKRQAVISHAVTKGLNPNAPMRDSGVEWLGEVPAHWMVCNMDHALRAIGDVDHYMPASIDIGVPYVMTGDLKEVVSGINFDACKQVSRSDYLALSKKIRGEKGDVIMARYATVGTVSYIDIDTEFLVSYSCVTIKPNTDKVIGLYLFYYFKSDAFLQGIQSQINTNTQGNVGVNDLKKIKVALPTLSEQCEIVDCLQRRIREFDLISDKAKAAIVLAQERRTALISAAVTGKIDVRDWQPPSDVAIAA